MTGMMDIRRLRLTGFKSFVDPTELRIERGMTGIVGPNGCGKSNLLEALRWAMGENRAKTMRGDGMEDVIFAGTDRRNAKAYAEVSMLLHSSTMLGEGDGEITITRRIQRGAGSSYRINGQETRARDVQHMFADAATGAHSSSLVRQGQVAQLIQAKPIDRRIVLEEAAGIAGLQGRRKEAEQKLRGSDENLEQVSKLIEELDRQIQNLTRQAKQAERYRELSAEIRLLDRALIRARYVGITERKIQVEQSLNECLRDLATCEHDQRDASAKLTQLEEALGQIRDEQQVSAHLVASSQFTLQEHRKNLTRRREAEEAIRHEQQQIALTQAEIKNEHDALQLEQAHIQAAKQEHEANKPTSDDGTLQARATELTGKIAGLRAKISELKQAKAVRQHRMEELGKQAAQLRNDLPKLETQLARATEVFDAAKRRLEKAQGDDSIQTVLTNITSQIDANEVERERLGKLRDQQAQILEHLEVDLAKARRDRDALGAECQGLEKLVANTSPERGDAVAHDIVVDEIHAAALAASLGVGLEAGTDPDIDGPYWRRLSHGEEIRPDSLAHLVQAPDELRHALARSRMCQNLEDALARQEDLLPGEHFVTPDGAIVRSDGLVVPAGQEPARAAYLRHAKRLQSLSTQSTKAEAKLLSAQAKRDLGVQEAQEVRDRLRELDRLREDLLRQRSHSERKNSEHERDLAVLEMEVATGARECDLLQERLACGRLEAAEIDKTLSAGLHEAQSDSQTTSMEAELLRLEEDHAQCRSKIAFMQEHEKNHVRDGQELKRQEEHHRARLEALKLRIQRHEAASSRLAEQITRLANEQEPSAPIDVLEAQHREACERQAKAEEKLAEHDRMSKQLRVQAQDHAARLGGLREKNSNLHNTKQELGEQISQLLGELAERFDEHIEDLLQDPDLPAQKPGDLQPLLERRNRERDALGPVNLRADIEIGELQEQHDKLETERAEVEEVVGKLRSAIRALNDEGKERLEKAFGEVNEHFQRLFGLLFEGGDASLQLVESDDPLEAGIEILAQPPGKKTKAMTLLSGGEQTLTALALIFAVFLTNPSPICVLDEVDAPLDDANVDRFCRLVRDISRRSGTKFLCITHHALTMARMDRLYGVTMAERGVSQLVTVDLDQAAAMVEQDEAQTQPKIA